MNTQSCRSTQSAHILLGVLLASLLAGLFLAGISIGQFWIVGLLLIMLGYLFS